MPFLKVNLKYSLAIEQHSQWQHSVPYVEGTGFEIFLIEMARMIQQRGLARFIVCLFLWFIFAKCDTEWIFDTLDSVVNMEEVDHVNKENLKQSEVERLDNVEGKSFNDFFCTLFL